MSYRHKLRLFLSYQRYGLLLGSMGLSLCWTTYWLCTEGNTPWRWPLVALIGVLALACLGFACKVAAQWPRKLRATALALGRIKSGRFSPRSLEVYCEDPCYRVVAREILRHSDLSRRQRRQIVKHYQRKASEPAFVMFVDPSTPQAVRLEGALFKPTR